jgi:CRP-like cAMP-binding protein
MNTKLSHGNQLVDALPAPEQRKLLDMAQMVTLSFEQVLHSHNESMPCVYFPTTAFISELVTTAQNECIEVHLVGHEGMLGLSLLLQDKHAPFDAVVQGAGEALRLSRKDFLHLLKHAPKLDRLLHRYTYVVIQQLAHNVACAQYHAIEGRLARWLLMTQDRAGNDTFAVTQEFLSHMLGASRVSITHAASLLKKLKLIHYVRGQMHILDREGLRQHSCSCYVSDIATYQVHMRN